MIAIFDEDGGGDVDFQEFVSGLSAFSSKGNKEEKLRFAFKVYDIDRDGYISNGELFIVLKMMVGSNLKDMQLQQVGLPSPTDVPSHQEKGTRRIVQAVCIQRYTRIRLGGLRIYVGTPADHL